MQESPPNLERFDLSLKKPIMSVFKKPESVNSTKKVMKPQMEKPLLNQEQWHMPVILWQRKLALGDQGPKALYYKGNSIIVLDGKHRGTLCQQTKLQKIINGQNTESVNIVLSHRWDLCITF